MRSSIYLSVRKALTQYNLFPRLSVLDNLSIAPMRVLERSLAGA